MSEVNVGPIIIWTALLVLGTSALVLRLYLNARTRPRRPPGPRGLPLLGNTLQMPTSHFGTYLKGLHSIHGGLVYLNVNGEHVYSIGDLTLASELLEKRSVIYSSRPSIPYVTRYVDLTEEQWILNRPGEAHYWGRKLSTTIMNRVKDGQTESLQRLEAISLIQRLLRDSGKDWYNHITRMSGSTVVAAMLGVRSVDVGDAPEVSEVLELVEAMTHILSPSASIINYATIIDDLLPSWIPAPWRKRATQWNKDDRDGWSALINDAVERQKAGMENWAQVFANENLPGGDKAYLVTQFAGAAIETTATALRSFILVCLAYPEWIETAQKELDNVVGRERLPTFQDRELLPFIEAVVREVLRWNPPARAGVPHQSTANDVVNYGGVEYIIPKGSTVFFSAYAIEHDPNRYEDPHIFRPQRHLDRDGLLRSDYKTSVFGFGRRQCVGIPFAERTLWMGIALILWTFNIRKPIDPQSGLSTPCNLGDDAFNGDFTNGPFSFPAIFEARDKDRIGLVQREWEEYDKDVTVLLPAGKR